MNKVFLTAALLVVIPLAGCETTTSFPYQPSTQNVMAFQTALRPNGAKVMVGAFTRDEAINTTPNCRMLGPVDVAPGKSMEQYIQDAVQTEMFQAGVVDSAARATITGRIDAVDLNTVGTGSWTIAMTMTSNLDQTGYQVSTTYPFSSSFSAMSACNNAAAAFGPAVNDLISKIIADPGFRRITGS